jgi:hypothetical protein
MGDRTSVTLTIPKGMPIPKYVKQSGGQFWEEESNIFYFEEVNYGELDFLHKLLEDGIPYDSEWDAGAEFGAGGEYLRFNAEGEAVLKTIYERDRSPSGSVLIDLLDDPKELVKYLKAFYEKIAILPVDNQEEYRKIYLMKRLIQPKE